MVLFPVLRFPMRDVRTIFDRVDNNSDGVIGAEEIETFLARLGGR